MNRYTLALRKTKDIDRVFEILEECSNSDLLELCEDLRIYIPREDRAPLNSGKLKSLITKYLLVL